MARKRKDSGIFGGFDAFSTGRKGRKSKGNRDFNDMAWQVKTGEKTVEEVQGILGTYYRQSRGVLYYLQDLAGKDVLASPAGAIQDIQDEE